jgi:hypothetical protein
MANMQMYRTKDIEEDNENYNFYDIKIVDPKDSTDLATYEDILNLDIGAPFTNLSTTTS